MKVQVVFDDDGRIVRVGSSGAARLATKEGEHLIESEGPESEEERHPYHLELIRNFEVANPTTKPALVRAKAKS